MAMAGVKSETIIDETLTDDKQEIILDGTVADDKQEIILDETVADAKQEIILDETVADDQQKTIMDGIMADDKQKIIIDTDCGVDDALAILLTLSSKDIAELIAITCCYGNTDIDNVCSNVMRVLTTCDEKEIPIHRGCRGPLLAPNAERAYCHGYDGLGNCSTEFSTGSLQENAVLAPVALIDYVKKYPKQITLIAIGPLTNIAIAHKMDPTFTANLKSLFIMGGNYKGVGNKTEVAEFNFYCDPEAADIILSTAECPITLIPWETTLDYGVKWATYNKLIEINTTKAYFFKQITTYPASRSAYKKNDQLCDCDFLAVAALLHPQCVTTQINKHLRVELIGELSRGLVIVHRRFPSTIVKKIIKVITGFNLFKLNKIRHQMLGRRVRDSSIHI